MHNSVHSDREQSLRPLLLPAVIFSFVLIVPLFELPRPSSVIGSPWKVELLASAALGFLLAFAWREISGALSRNGFAHSVLLILIAFCALSLASALWAQFPANSLHHTFLWGLYASTFVAGVWVCRREDGIRLLLFCLAATAMLIASLCLLDLASMVDFTASEGTFRIRWAKYAELLVTASPLLVAAGIAEDNKRLRTIYFAAGAAGWVAAQMSLSKAAFISGLCGFFALFLVILVRGVRGHRRLGVLVLAGWAVLTLATQVTFSFFSTVPSTTQYITGTADTTRETSSMRVFTWKVTSQMISDNPILGVGADSFGSRFNESRQAYALERPDDVDHAIGEDYLFERAHNEYLQIVAELGVAGFGLFGLLVIYFGRQTASTLVRGGDLSPLIAGSLGGLVAFGVSSLFTSFSFRAAQNGIVLFAVLSLLTVLISESAEESSGDERPRSSNAPVTAFVLISVLCLGAYSAARGVGHALLTLADRDPDRANAIRMKEWAMAIDPEPANAAYSLSFSLQHLGGNARSAELMRTAIDRGIGISQAYTRLADLHLLNGDSEAAINALREGISVFPRSVYLRVRLAIMFEDTERRQEADEQMRTADTISPKDAKGWHNLIRLGGLKAFLIAREGSDVTEPAMLKPAGAVYQYLDETIPPENTSN